MKNTIAFIVGAGILVAIGGYFIAKNPDIFDQVINWALSKMGIGS